MTREDILTVASLGEIKNLSRVGIAFFQIYDKERNPAFYETIGTLQPHERIAEFRTDQMDAVRRVFRNAEIGKNIFGAFLDGFLYFDTTDVTEGVKLIVEVRQSFVPDDRRMQDIPRGSILVEGAGPVDFEDEGK